MPSPGGSRRCGPARKARGGPWSLARLRGRSRLLHDAAAGQDLVPARPHPGRAGPRPLPQTDLHRRPDLLQTRPPFPADLPAPPDDGRRDGRKSFSWRDYRDLLIAAHQQLGGPIVLVWDNLNVHKAAGLREFAAARDWLTIYYLPPYAPDLNPVEGIWSLLRRGWLSNVAFSTPEHLIQTVRAAYGTSSTAATS